MERKKIFGIKSRCWSGPFAVLEWAYVRLHSTNKLNSIQISMIWYMVVPFVCGISLFMEKTEWVKWKCVCAYGIAADVCHQCNPCFGHSGWIFKTYNYSYSSVRKKKQLLSYTLRRSRYLTKISNKINGNVCIRLAYAMVTIESFVWKIHIVCVSTQHKQISANTNKTTEWNLQDENNAHQSVAVQTREYSGRVMCHNKTSLAKAFHHKIWSTVFTFDLKLNFFFILLNNRNDFNTNICVCNYELELLLWLFNFSEISECKRNKK